MLGVTTKLQMDFEAFHLAELGLLQSKCINFIC